MNKLVVEIGVDVEVETLAKFTVGAKALTLPTRNASARARVNEAETIFISFVE